MADYNEAIKTFQLVEFDPSNKKQTRGTIECVPSTWISFNPSTGRCQCKFMPPPYSSEDSELLCSLVKEQSPPPESWPVYPMTLKGHAGSYEDAMKRLTILEEKKFAYTEDGTLPEKKSETAKKAYQRIKLKCDEAAVEKLMRVQPFTSDNDYDVSNGDSSSEISDSTSLVDNSVRSKKKLKKNKIKTETESSDENSNVINKLRKKPNRKSKIKQYPTKIRGHGSSIRKDRVEEAPRTLSNNTSLSYKSKSKNSKSSSLRSQHALPASLDALPASLDASPAPQDVCDTILASNRNQEDKVKARNSCRMEAVAEKLKPPSSLQSLNNYRKIEPEQGKSSSAEVVKYTEYVSEENSSKPNQRDCNVLNGLRFDVQMLTKAINELKGIVKRSALAKDAYGANVQSFATQYDLKLPVTTLEDFDAFDDKLKADKKFRQELASTLHFIFDPNATLPKNITALLKKNISRDVALNFNAVKAGKGKRIFKETKLCGILLDVLLLKCKEGSQGSLTHISEKSFYQELGNCLSNAIDWDGNRKSRTKKKSEVSTAITVPQAVRVNSHSAESLSDKSPHKSSDT